MLKKIHIPSGVFTANYIYINLTFLFRAMPRDESLDTIFRVGKFHVSISIVVIIMNIQCCVLVFTLNIIFQTLAK